MKPFLIAFSLILLSSQLYSQVPAESEKYNVHFGTGALSSLKEGDLNTAIGSYACGALESGGGNTAIGAFAGSGQTHISDTILIGLYAGQNITEPTENAILIGNSGTNNDSGAIRIGEDQCRCFITGIHDVEISNNNALPVIINAAGQLGTSSQLITIIREQSETVTKLIKQIENLTHRIAILESK